MIMACPHLTMNNIPTSPGSAHDDGLCYMANDGNKPYEIEVLATTDYVAIENDRGIIAVHHTGDVGSVLHAERSRYLRLWACGHSLDTSPSGDLLHIACMDNELTKLDVSRCTALTGLACHKNRLTSLDLTQCVHLRTVVCGQNQLNSLKMQGLTVLSILDCSENKLCSLDLSTCGKLMQNQGELDCSKNPLIDITLTSSQLVGDLLAGQLGSKGQLNVICDHAYAAVAGARRKVPAAWRIHVLDEPSQS